MTEQSATNPIAQLMKEEGERSIALTDALKAIRLAKENDNIKGIYLEAGALAAGPANMTTLRRALADFKKSGKFIVAYSDEYRQRCNYLCSDANREQIGSYMGSIWGNMLSAIEEDHKIIHEDLSRFINEGMMMGEPQQAVDYKLTDALFLTVWKDSDRIPVTLKWFLFKLFG